MAMKTTRPLAVGLALTMLTMIVALVAPAGDAATVQPTVDTAQPTVDTAEPTVDTSDQEPGLSGFYDVLPRSVQRRVLWFADHEEGNLADWTDEGFRYPGGGIFNTGSQDQAFAEASAAVANSGQYSARAHIQGAVRAQNGNRAVRLMRWLDTAWDDGGDYYPKRAFYSTFVYMPEPYNPNKYEPWDPGDGGWWNIFQFKADIEESSDSSVPMFTVNVAHDDETGENHLYLYSKYNPPYSFEQRNPIPLPIGEWVHIEAYYVAQTARRGGAIMLFQDGRRIFNLRRVNTIMTTEFPNPTWGIGNYTDHIAGGSIAGNPIEGTADLYFDDAAVSTTRLSRYLSRFRR